MEYRDAVIKAADTIRKDGSPSVIDIADALVDAYNAGRAEPLDLSPDERIVSAQAWEAFQCWQRDQKPELEEAQEPPKTCRAWLWNHDQPYPKSCPTCGIGGACKFGILHKDRSK